MGAVRAILKTEPSEYSFEDLQRDGKTAWTGIRNFAALKNLEKLKMGDAVAVYHTGDEKAAVGIGIIARPAYRVHGQPDKFLAVDVRAGRRLPRPVKLEEMKNHPAFAQSPLVTMGRLSVVLLTVEQSDVLDALSRRSTRETKI